MSFVDMLLFMARTSPQKNAMILPDRMVTFGMLGLAIRSVAARLNELIADKNAIVAVDIESPTRHLVAVSALYHLGIVSVSVTASMNLVAAGVNISVMLSDSPVDSRGSFLNLVFSDSWLEQLPRSEWRQPAGFQSDQQLARIIMSSGTTAHPKAIGMSVRVVEDRIVTGRRTLALAPWDRMMCLPVLTSSLGFGTILQGLAYGHTVLIAESALDALQMIATYQADLLVANPQNLRDMVALHKSNPIPITSLNLIKYGGNPLSPVDAAEVRMRFCKEVMCVYSSTESGPIAYGHVDHIRKNPKSTGFVAPWIKAEIVDWEGRLVPAGVHGRLRVKSKWQGYDLKSGSQSADDWIYTGDTASLQHDGSLELRGRAVDAIKVGSQMVAPEEIEHALAGYPDLIDCAVVGVKSSPDADDEIWVEAVATEGFDFRKMQAFLLSKNPLWKVSHCHKTGLIERNRMGKIVRENIRRRLSHKD